MFIFYIFIFHLQLNKREAVLLGGGHRSGAGRPGLVGQPGQASEGQDEAHDAEERN